MLEWVGKLFKKEEREPTSLPLRALLHLAKLERRRLDQKQKEEDSSKPRRAK